MKVVIYEPYDADENTLELTHALGVGFKMHGDHVLVSTPSKADQNGDVQMAVFTDLRERHIYKKHQRASHHVMIVDKGLINHKNYRFGIDGFTTPMLKSWGESRLSWMLDNAGLRLQPQTPSLGQGNLVLYIGAEPLFYEWHNLGAPIRRDFTILKTITKTNKNWHNILYYTNIRCTAKLPARVDFGPKHQLEENFRKCVAVVTLDLQWATRALIEGKPVVIPIGNTKDSLIDPRLLGSVRDLLRHGPIDQAYRDQLLQKLAWYEFSPSEISRGFAWQVLMQRTAKRLEKWTKQLDHNPNDRDFLIEQYKVMHEQGRYGGSLQEHNLIEIKDLVNKFDPQSLLDYGSGKGNQYSVNHQHRFWGGLRPHCYDPAWPEHAAKPEGTFDGVICTDVAEHIPEANVETFFRDVLSYAKKFAYFYIFIGEATKKLPDGRNAHLTIRPSNWWCKRLSEAAYKEWGLEDGHWTENTETGTFELRKHGYPTIRVGFCVKEEK